MTELTYYTLTHALGFELVYTLNEDLEEAFGIAEGLREEAATNKDKDRALDIAERLDEAESELANEIENTRLALLDHIAECQRIAALLSPAAEAVR